MTKIQNSELRYENSEFHHPWLYNTSLFDVEVEDEDDKGKVQLATVGAGSIVGEGAFFSRTPRNATVQAMNRCTLWGLSPMRYAELAHKHPSIALSFVMALGSVVTRRMTNKPKRGAVT